MNEIVILGTIAAVTANNLIETKKDILRERFSERFIIECQEKLSVINSRNEQFINEIKSDFCLEINDYGVFGSLWDFAKVRNTGIEVYLKDIPIEQETVEICEVFDINPYISLSEEVYILSVKSGYDTIQLCEKNGICAKVVGIETNNNDRVIINGDERRFLTPIDREDYFTDRYAKQ